MRTSEKREEASEGGDDDEGDKRETGQIERRRERRGDYVWTANGAQDETEGKGSKVEGWAYKYVGCWP